MNDLISRAWVLAEYDRQHKGPPGGARKIMEEAPAVDAVPVVRCKDCKYGEPETNGFGEDMVMCQNKQNPIGYEDWLMPPEFYCADGERRDDAG